MMLILGLFIFSIDTLAYQSLQKSNEYRHPGNDRVGMRPAYQYVGPGESSVTLSGWIGTQYKGTALSLDVLEQMARTGKAYMLVSGRGRVYGAYVIESITEDHSIFYANGQPRRIDFTIKLKKVDEDLIDKLLGDITIPDLGGLF